MPDKVFFDTNVLVYAISQDARASQAETILSAGGLVSVQVLNEFVSVARRKLGMSWQHVNETLQAIRILCPSPVPISIAIHESALKIAEKYGYRIYDALIAAAALEARCTTLYSEDLQDGQVLNSTLSVRNPFK